MPQVESVSPDSLGPTRHLPGKLNRPQCRRRTRSPDPAPRLVSPDPVHRRARSSPPETDRPRRQSGRSARRSLARYLRGFGPTPTSAGSAGDSPATRDTSSSSDHAGSRAGPAIVESNKSRWYNVGGLGQEQLHAALTKLYTPTGGISNPGASRRLRVKSLKVVSSWLTLSSGDKARSCLSKGSQSGGGVAISRPGMWWRIWLLRSIFSRTNSAAPAKTGSPRANPPMGSCLWWARGSSLSARRE